MTTAADLSPAAVEACIELVREQRHGVSFPELRTVCDDLGVLTAGDAILGAAAIPGVVLWAEMSGAFPEIVAAVHAHTSTGLVACPRPVPPRWRPPGRSRRLPAGELATEPVRLPYAALPAGRVRLASTAAPAHRS